MGFIQDYVIAIASSWWVLPIIFALCCIDGFFPPFPSESILITLGSVAAVTGQVHIVFVCILGALGAWLGDVIAYHIGRYIPLRKISFLNKGKGKIAVQKAESSLESRGVFLILVARFIPVGRIAVNMVAGAMKYSRIKFVIVAFFAGFVWSVYSIILGYSAGVVLYNNPLLAIVIGILLGVLSGLILDRLITWFGNFLAKRIVEGTVIFFRNVSVEDIENQGIVINSDKVYKNVDLESDSFEK